MSARVCSCRYEVSQNLHIWVLLFLHAPANSYVDPPRYERCKYRSGFKHQHSEQHIRHPSSDPTLLQIIGKSAGFIADYNNKISRSRCKCLYQSCASSSGNVIAYAMENPAGMNMKVTTALQQQSNMALRNVSTVGSFSHTSNSSVLSCRVDPRMSRSRNCRRAGWS